MKTRFKAVWSEILAPDYNVGADILMLIVEWMFKTGWKYRDSAGVFELLHGLSSINAQYYCDHYSIPTDRKTLTEYIQRAILSKLVCSEVKEWRVKFNLNYHGSRIIHAVNDVERCSFGLYDGCNSFDNQITKLFSFRGKKLNYSPNKYHKNAKNISDIYFFCAENGLGINVDYGEDGSSWKLAEYVRGSQYLPVWIDSIIVELDKKIQ